MGSLTESIMDQCKVTTLDQEPDTIAYLPTDPDYIVIGTYSLVPRTENDKDAPSSKNEGNRIGSLQIRPLRSTSTQRSSSRASPSLDRRDFPFGIYDLRFHPLHIDLLGVATSDAEILFFRVAAKYDSHDVLTAIELVEVGKILVEDPHEDDGARAIVTQFQFQVLDGSSAKHSDQNEHVYLAATTQFGNTKFVKITVPLFEKSMSGLECLEYQTIDVHKQSFDLEAWTVLPIFTDPSTLWLFSGGDDSQLIISSITSSADASFGNPNLDLELMIPTPQHIDKRGHEAGVVYICTLGTVLPHPTQPVGSHDSTERYPDYLVLTGSYDEYIRLFIFAPTKPDVPKPVFSLVAELNLGGGVWRIIPLDSYDTEEGHDYILLVAAHTAGACIVRLSGVRSTPSTYSYTFSVEKWFTEGHKSLVYAVAGKRAADVEKAWDLISASFYDKVICEWSWIDEKSGGSKGIAEALDSI